MEGLLATVAESWPVVAGGMSVGLSLLASAHVILYKRDSRAAVAWVGLIWLVPVVGSGLYVLLGVNRIKRRAAARRPLRAGSAVPPAPTPLPPERDALPPAAAHLEPLARLAAIESARSSVALSTYIFDNDAAGALFLDALERAVRRGVAVRVLVDAVGARYSWPPIIHALRRRAVPVAAFSPTVLPWRMAYFNLRNHRKILVVDGRAGFTGGLNIRAGHVLEDRPRHPVRDTHFRVEGPVVAHLLQAFAEDWAFTRGETLAGETWFPPLP